MSRPALSPYLNMYRGELGFTDPYNAFVRPYMQQNQRPERRTTNTGTAGSITSAYPNNELLRARARSQQQATAGIAPTGTGSSFMNLGHFYQMPRGRR